MRLTDDQVQAIRQLAHQVGGGHARVRVFGYRLDDLAKGGDLDLVLELPEPVDNPALMAAQLSALVSRRMFGRKVDVLLSAPNLKCLPIHELAFSEGAVVMKVEQKSAMRLQLLAALSEKTAAVIDNLDRAERLGPIGFADDWITLRNLSNQMVHEYVEDPAVLTSALQSGHTFVPVHVAAAEKMITEIERRGWA